MGTTQSLANWVVSAQSSDIPEKAYEQAKKATPNKIFFKKIVYMINETYTFLYKKVKSSLSILLIYYYWKYTYLCHLISSFSLDKKLI